MKVQPYPSPEMSNLSHVDQGKCTAKHTHLGLEEQHQEQSNAWSSEMCLYLHFQVLHMSNSKSSCLLASTLTQNTSLLQRDEITISSKQHSTWHQTEISYKFMELKSSEILEHRLSPPEIKKNFLKGTLALCWGQRHQVSHKVTTQLQHLRLCKYTRKKWCYRYW